ncbi:hypothetical protein LJC68_05595 [Bacteroidales bacterium OttesenSCG-928-B11]|nr:hypothetical protein [Bacteroidales bacterium OttesenSCG-928-E04]MDL2312331.1 hypothetical protein [Bacteroidales bacterium OttesenSCG-928-B11]MDL2326278.1 hypothetical protein [Bacteroidales bacterium OttesenSCG-928-A14]
MAGVVNHSIVRNITVNDPTVELHFGCPEATIVSIPTRNGVSVRCVRVEN